jgi:hypothetical protein
MKVRFVGETLCIEAENDVEVLALKYWNNGLLLIKATFNADRATEVPNHG